MHTNFQDIALLIAEERGVARPHLDLEFWSLGYENENKLKQQSK